VLDSLQKFDQELFLWIQRKTSHWFLDQTMPVLTDLHKEPLFVYGFLPLVLATWIFKQRLYALKVILGLTLCIGATDMINSKLLKPYFKRARPSHTLTNVDVKARHNSGYSFPSTHAANNFAGAVFLSLIYPWLSRIFFSIAILVCFSRVYVGVHFPLDVICGALWASFFAHECFRLWRKLIPSNLPKYDVHLN